MLQFFKASPEATMPDVADALGLSRSTTYRIAERLRELGFLEINPISGRWRLGREAVQLGVVALQSTDIMQVAPELLRALLQMAGEAVNLAVFDADSMVLLYREQGPQSITIIFPPRLAPADARQFARQGVPVGHGGHRAARAPRPRLSSSAIPIRPSPAWLPSSAISPRRAAAAIPSTAASSRRRWLAAPRRCSTIVACRWRRSACRGRPSALPPSSSGSACWPPRRRGRFPSAWGTSSTVTRGLRHQRKFA